MKKALLAALTFVVVGFVLVSGTYAVDLGEVMQSVFQTVEDVFKGFNPFPEKDSSGKIDVALVSRTTSENQQLYPGGAVSHATSVRNEGTGGVYFRLVYAVQCEPDSWDKLTVSFTPGAGFQAEAWQDIKIAGVDYKMMVFTYTGLLAAGAESPGVEINIAMDENITSEQISRYRSDFLQVQVLAIDPEAFATEGPDGEKILRDAVESLNMAIPLNNLNPF